MLKTYLENIKDISTNDKEHTHRTALQNLLQAIKENQDKQNKIHIKQEPNNDKEGRGAPDFLITKDFLTLGYIENKRVNANLDNIIKSDQILKYTKLSPNIILTDYLRFILLSLNEKNEVIVCKEVKICSLDEIKSVIKNQSLLDTKTQELNELFSIFFSKIPNSINSALEFAHHLSLRTRILKDELLLSSKNETLISLFNTFKETLYKELHYEEFCDSFAQTLTYSLFLAKLNNNTTKEIDLNNAKKFIPKSFPLIRSMSGFLDDSFENLENIKWLLEEIINIINHIDITSIIKELNKTSEKDLFDRDILSTHKDPYLHFYETFLASYDPKLREVRGVYYTPAPVVNFIINAIDEILKQDFNHKKGLSEALNKDITLLDFATGTGTFLLEAFRKALEPINKNSVNYNPKALIDKFCGFEFLIAPYTIAHLKISQSFKEEFNSPLNDDESLKIALTNTLYFKSISKEQNDQNTLFTLIDLTKEFKKAQKIKEEQILIITGNPPYSGASSNKGLYEDEIKISYGLEPSKANLSKEQKEYINLYFQEKTKQNTSTFKAIYEKHKLENEKNPKVMLDDYVKFIRFAQSKIDSQESGIFAFISNNGFLDNPTFRGMRYSLMQSFDKIYILNLHGDTRKKEKAPDGSKDDNVFDIMQGVSINIFIKQNSKVKNTKIYYHDLYGKRKDKYEFLYENDLNSIKWTLVKNNEPFYLFLPQNNDLLEEYNKGISVKDIFMLSSVGIASSKDAILISTNNKKLEQQVYNFYNEFDKKYIKEIAYRPFDMQKIYYDIKKVERPRIDIMEHFLGYENIGLIYDRGTNLKEISNLFISSKVIDKHLVGANSYVSPLYLYPTTRSKKFLKKENPNFNEENFTSKIENFKESFRAFIDELYKAKFSPEDILGYIYAVLFHKFYREKYFDFLKIDFPKIPFTKDKNTFKNLSKLGLKLINLHLLKNDELDFNVGEALFKDIKNKNFKIQKIKYNKGTKELFINESLYFSKVSLEIYEFKIGGYAVLDKYLKSHKEEDIDHNHFTLIIQTLNETLKIQDEISKINLS
ncbi:TPA: type ISP restriction/modification enzyme [Campylobacter jejuni]|uniref:type ISP restriction/modification enzyme n=1 Tax=Campylobacter jejuni TaxID=197 RepID=UPI0002586F07|nr:type ISP restriction/modification enzyme [Campylobacter jejuni]ECP8784824.1 N-6 DNA methylase [Campylobacter jejuni]ECQ5143898.1 N-6 DNA methylase [Campylobacter jejuni]ECR3171623.1 N-6 DNA methylase [Campylobacter jejuni]EDP4964930.1 N-6 DNA methylase [Campylobacter jejuni]EIB88487.1 D12 class N6 adenine-specific DNA methyltransferase, putative [Campylobacter jejuni subsp. jejuni LMG 23211]